MAVHCPYLIAFKVVEYPEGLFCRWQWNDTFGEFLSFESYFLGLFVVTRYVPLVLIAILYFAIALRIKSQKIPGEQSANVRERRLKIERNVLRMSIASVIPTLTTLLVRRKHPSTDLLFSDSKLSTFYNSGHLFLTC